MYFPVNAVVLSSLPGLVLFAMQTQGGRSVDQKKLLSHPARLLAVFRRNIPGASQNSMDTMFASKTAHTSATAQQGWVFTSPGANHANFLIPALVPVLLSPSLDVGSLGR